MFKSENLENYVGLNYLKSYLFLSLVFILYARNIDLIKPLSLNITVLSLFSILLFLLFLITQIFLIIGIQWGINMVYLPFHGRNMAI